MSLDIEWSKLDQELAVHVQHFLNRHFKSIAKPAFIGDIEVTAFEWGTESPRIEITNITDPFPEFYEEEHDDNNADDVDNTGNTGSSDNNLNDSSHLSTARSTISNPTTTTTSTAATTAANNSPTTSQGNPQHPRLSTEMDFQTSMLISYKGDMSMTLMTELRMNYPSMMFMSLPIQLRIRSIEFESTAIVAYIKSMDRVCVSMLEPEQSEEHVLRGREVSLESLLREVQIESIVGDSQKQVLKNVGKVERFIVDQLRKMLDDELVFPSYQCIQLD
ncbi:hypothetical protein BDB00DRAFT_772285 [Zychaea mexicana]|uniref:uncharacterized protein n=1 Tax=Zychaea mexicana TaxID=64656 RepID=UPI0022FEE6FC|nr:uncharacterized protein BDB00DRAFT_772285 [Zychaea mexicana]KAI9488516.1 hypothetical protein BDB00DRAFT_772285 [Zychaea mexicana]